ncbi:MAG: diguanylate cyclase [Xanthomonadaceae bacterium]|nr:diguanylate cyclase [Xanthomonadaceae bacterium]
MSDRILQALDEVRLRAGAAAILLSEGATDSSTRFVVAVAPAGLVALATPLPLHDAAPGHLEADPARLPALLPVALRLALPAPATHAWTQALPETALHVTLAWTQPPPEAVTRALASWIDDHLRLAAIEFTLRQRLSLENARLQTVWGVLDQAIVTIDGLRQEAMINRAAERLLGVPGGIVPARQVSEALRRFQDAALNHDAVAAVAGTLARQPDATVTGVVWQFARAPTHVRVTTAPLDGMGARGRIWVFDDISVQMIALQAAEEARARYRLLAENADDIVFRQSPQGTVEWISESVTAALGWAEQDIVGQPLEAFVHPEDRDQLREADVSSKDAGATPVRSVYRARFNRKDGTCRWLEVSIRSVIDASGSVEAWVGSARDVQEQIETQHALARSQQRLRASVDGMLDPQVLLAPVRDAAGTIIDFIYMDVNRATTEYLSVSAEALIGTSLLAASPGLRESGLFAMCAKAMECDEPVVADDFLFSNERLGLVRRYDIRGSRMGDALTLTWRDTTDRFEAQQRIATSERYFRLLAENSANVVTLVRGGRIDWVSPSLTRALGWQPAQWLGCPYLDFIHPDDRSAAVGAVSAVEASGARVLRLRVRALSGRFHWTEVSADAYIGADGTRDGMVASFRTIDAEVAAEAALARMARFDTLIGLANRTEALHRFAERQSPERRSEGASAVLFCDVDRFKAINDLHGHAAGDQVLIVLAQRIRACVRSDDICARMGGDELLVILDGIHDLAEAGSIAEKIRSAVEIPIPLGNDQEGITTSMSIGVALAAAGETFDEVMARADTAMYEAKKKGRNQVVLVG